VIRALASAVLARLEAAPALTGKVIDGAVDPEDPPFPPPYLVVYVNSGRRSVERESSDQPTRADSRIITHAVGVDANQARYWSEKVLEQLLGWRPVIAGWSPEAVAHDRSLPVETDKSTSPPTQYLTDSFTLVSRKA
jgi:hypothetical protein